MNRLYFGFLSLLLSLFASSGRAQVIDEPIAVPVKFSADGLGIANQAPYACITLGGVISANTPVYSTPYTTPGKTAYLEVGKTYTATVESRMIYSLNVHFVAPPGYKIFIDQLQDNTLSWVDSHWTAVTAHSIRIIPEDGSTPNQSGASTSIQSGRVKWDAFLGALPNGASAGEIELVGGGVSAWTEFYQPAGLNYESLSPDDVKVYRATPSGGLNAIRQISAPQTFVDIVIITATSYEIRFYHPAQAPGTTLPRTPTGLPFTTYLIEKGSTATKLQITKYTRTLTSTTDTTAAVARTDYTILERTGTSPAFVWTLTDWTQSGQTPATVELREWSGNVSGGHDEQIKVQDNTSTVVAQTHRVHTHHAWGDTPTQITAGPASASDAVIATITYNTDASVHSSYGFPSQSTTTGGGWSVNEYLSTTDTLKFGTVSRTFAPFLNSPATFTTNPSLGLVTNFSYNADIFGLLRRPTLIETRANGILILRSVIQYSEGSANGMNTIIAAKTDVDTSTSSGITTTNTYYREDTLDLFFRDQIHTTKTSYGTRQSFIRQRGTWNNTTKSFTAGAGGASRIGVITGLTSPTTGATESNTYSSYTIATTYLVSGKSTLELTIRDAYARIARTEVHVWDGTTWQLINWTNFTYNLNNQLIARTSNNGDVYDADYLGELKLWERDGAGIKTSYTYDNARRVKTVIKEGANGIPDLITEYNYDAADRVIKQETHAASGSTEKLTTSRAYDLAGRALSESSPGVGATSYAYDPVNRSQTVITPNLATRTQTTFIDGRLNSITGTGTVAEHYTYGVESNGSGWTQVNLAAVDSPRWSKTWTDSLGRVVRSERPTFTGQANFVERSTYNLVTGQLLRTYRTDTSTTFYTYNSFGQRVLSGIDLNNDSTLNLAGNDRVSGQDQWFVHEEGAWWAASRIYTYATPNSSAETTTSSIRERLTGFTGNLRAESRSTDAEGNTATATVFVDRSTRTTTKITQAPGLSGAQVETAINGLGTTATTADGLVFTTGYDALHRPVSSTNVRNGVTRTATTAYETDTARPFTITDPTGTITATYAYDIMGRKSSVKNADNKYARFTYTPRSELARQWGEATAPASFDYSIYGERTSLTTYRTDGSWDGTDWPSTPPAGDTTTWEFDGPSGLLKKKTDAATRYVEYDYNSRGQVLHRYWARTLDGTINTDRVTATYAYDTLTAEPLSITYNDGTHSVTTAYTRLGQVATVADYTGTRTFAYDASSPWRLASDTLPAFYQGNVFTPLYETTTDNVTGTVKGRTRGFQLGTVATPAALIQQTYTVNALGRLTGVTAARANGASTQAFAYTYLTGSRLLESVAATGTAFTATRTYEPYRDLLTGIKAQWSTATKSEFTYTHDAFGRRETAAQSGDGFADYGDTVRQKFTYNDRGQLTDAKGYLGAEDPSNKLPGRQFQFGYDAAGNRTSANHSGDPAKADAFTVNELNQLSSRQNKAVSISGTAAADASVVADNQATTRKGRFWQLDLLQDSVAIPLARSFVTVAAKLGAGTGGADLAQIDRRYIWLAGHTETLTYDADGNLKADDRWTYTWDAENRLTSMEGNAWTAIAGGPARQRLEFRYDSAGRRVLKRTLNEAAVPATWTLATETRFLYDGWNLLAEYEASGPSPLALRRTYTWGLDLTGSLTASGGIGGLLQITDHSTGASYFPTYDGNGNVITLVNAATGNLGASYEYNAFGEPLRVVGPYAKANPFRFSTKFTDNESGLIYYGHRYYDAHNGRFINRDPIEERGGMNLYGFCGNDGVNQWDYLGQFSLKKMFKKAGDWIKKNTAVVALTAGILSGGILLAAAPLAWGLTTAAGVLTQTGMIAVGATVGAVSSAVGTALTGAGLGEVLQSGLIGGAIGGISAYAGYSVINKFLPPSLSFLSASSIPRAASMGFVSGATSGGLNTAIYGGKTLKNISTGALYSSLSNGVSEAIQTLYWNYKVSGKFETALEESSLDPGIKSNIKIAARAYLAAKSITPGATIAGAVSGGIAGYAMNGNPESAAIGALAGAGIGYLSSGLRVNSNANTTLSEIKIDELGLKFNHITARTPGEIYMGGEISAAPVVFGIPINRFSVNVSGSFSLSQDFQTNQSFNFSMGSDLRTDLPYSQTIRGGRPID